MLTYKRWDHLEVLGYSDSDYAGCIDTRKSTFGYIFLLAEGAVRLMEEFEAIHYSYVNYGS
jgi:hypothetical protein